MIEVERYPAFADFPVVHGFSTRRGGVSIGPFASLNLGKHNGDEPKAVTENRRIFFERLDVPAKQLVFPGQVHSAHVEIVNKAGIVPDCDALITNTPGLFLTIQTADCFPVFLLDPVQKVLALAHSGWRGTAAAITPAAITRMVEHFGCRPQDMHAIIGPGISQQNYQVDRATAAHFEARYCLPDGQDHFLLDVGGAVFGQLLQSGLPEGHITVDGRCTYERSDLFFSYRRDGKRSGRMMGLLGLVES